MTVVAGVDGCRGGWLCLWGDPGGRELRGRVLVRIEELLELDPRPEEVGVDIPIGLPASGARACDREARRLLGRSRGSSVFPAPIRPLLEAGSYEEACAIGERVHGRKLSRQAWNILPRVREVDEFLLDVSDRATWIREVHPEVSFALWNRRSPMTHNKKTPAGRAEREALAQKVFGTGWRAALPASGYAPDDALDALAVLWSARRIAAGTALRLPDEPERDPRGLPMGILA
ncbi:MAG TPA: DUF429 domain-containing protein [Gammaproteobacteria bacterium]|nr:DUF429 domain-containing protein [Gammaproteobacteria bacterium]